MSKHPKACPFAHPVAKGAQIEPVNDHFHGVCQDCGAQGPQASSYAEALKFWNARRKGDGEGGLQ